MVKISHVTRILLPDWSILQVSTPVLMVVSLMLLIVVCTLVMLCDYQVKRAKYSDWKKTAALSVSR